MNKIVETILSEGFAEFSRHGEEYLIQQESNKGCHYLSLWRTAPKAACLCRVCFDVFDGVSEETVEELFDGLLPDGRTLRDMLQSPETVVTGRDGEQGRNPCRAADRDAGTDAANASGDEVHGLFR